MFTASSVLALFLSLHVILHTSLRHFDNIMQLHNTVMSFKYMSVMVLWWNTSAIIVLSIHQYKAFTLSCHFFYLFIYLFIYVGRKRRMNERSWMEEDKSYHLVSIFELGTPCIPVSKTITHGSCRCKPQG